MYVIQGNLRRLHYGGWLTTIMRALSNERKEIDHAQYFLYLPTSQSSGFSVLSLCWRFTLLNPPQEGRKAAFNRVNFETFEQVHHERFDRRCAFFQPYVRKVIYRGLDCGDPHNGFARVRCVEWGLENHIMKAGSKTALPFLGECPYIVWSPIATNV